MQLVFATNNKNKVYEVSRLLEGKHTLLSLEDIGCLEELEETGDTLEANALQKAKYVAEKYNCACFADDTGLEVEALDGRPGVYSARYAGPGKSADSNMEKVLRELSGKENRSARFRTVIALILGKQEFIFEGNVDGRILTTKRGTQGFGYDPIFAPLPGSRSFAEMSLEEKNLVSHRARAILSLTDFLRKIG